MSETQEDLAVMGTKAEAEANLLSHYERYTKYTGPVMGTSKSLKIWESERREAEVRFVQAAALFGWHLKRERDSKDPAP